MPGYLPTIRHLEPWVPRALLERTSGYDPLIYKIETKEDLFRVSKAILKSRADRYYYKNRPEPTPPTFKPSLPRDVAKALPPGDVKDLAIKEWKRHDADIRDYQYELDSLKQMDEALKSKDGSLAYQYLQEHVDDFEERLDLLNYRDPPGSDAAIPRDEVIASSDTP